MPLFSIALKGRNTIAMGAAHRQKGIKSNTMHSTQPNNDIFTELDSLLTQPQPATLLSAYWLIGQYIVMKEQRAKRRAFYGSAFLQNFSEVLTAKYGRGFSRRNVINMRRLFIFSPIRQSVFNGSLTWTHYTEILKAKSYQEVYFYKEQTEKCQWSVKQLKQQMKQRLFQRLLVHEIIDV